MVCGVSTDTVREGKKTSPLPADLRVNRMWEIDSIKKIMHVARASDNAL